MKPPVLNVPGTLVIPGNITIEMNEGAGMEVGKGSTLHVEGKIRAGRYRIFFGDGEFIGSRMNDVVYPQWFGARGDGINRDSDAIASATRFAQGARLAFHEGSYLIGPEKTVINCDVNWVGCDREKVRMLSDDSRGHVPDIFIMRKSASISGITFNGNKCRSRGIIFEPEKTDSIRIDGCRFMNLVQPSNASGKPVGLGAVGVIVYGRHEEFTAINTEFIDITATASPNQKMPRPKARGIEWSVNGRTHGSSHRATISGCVFKGIRAGENWGSRKIDVDAIVWRNLKSEDSKLTVERCSFISIGKRPIKANVGHSITINECCFSEMASSRYLNLALQDSPDSSITNCIFDFPTALNFPSEAVIKISTDHPQGIKNMRIINNTIRVRDQNAVSAKAVIILESSRVCSLRMSNNSIEIPGGIDYCLIVRTTLRPHADKDTTCNEITIDGNRVFNINTELVSISGPEAKTLSHSVKEESNVVLYHEHGD